MITVTRNDHIGLASTWDSLRDQTYDEFEWIVVDGLSTDGTAQWALEVGDSRVYFASEIDSGIYDAMNKGLGRISGDLVVFMNSADRFYSPSVLEDVVSSFRSQKWRWAYGGMRIVDRHGAELEYSFRENFKLNDLCLGLRSLGHQAVFFTTQLLHEVGIYRIEFGVESDQEFMLRAALLADPHVITKPLADFLSGGISSGGRPDAFVKAARVMRQRNDLIILNEPIDWCITQLLAFVKVLRNVGSRLIQGSKA